MMCNKSSYLCSSKLQIFFSCFFFLEQRLVFSFTNFKLTYNLQVPSLPYSHLFRSGQCKRLLMVIDNSCSQNQIKGTTVSKHLNKHLSPFLSFSRPGHSSHTQNKQHSLLFLQSLVISIDKS